MGRNSKPERHKLCVSRKLQPRRGQTRCATKTALRSEVVTNARFFYLNLRLAWNLSF